MSGPQFRFSKVKIPVGITTGSSYIEAWHADALLVSEGHCNRLRDRRKGQSSNFYTYKRSVTHEGGQSLTYKTFAQPNFATYKMCGVAGPSTRAPLAPFGNIPSFAQATDGLSQQYAHAYAKARPGNPVASLAQFTAELRDLPKMPFVSLFNKPKRNRRYGRPTVSLWQLPRELMRRAWFFKQLGSEYLNYAFGWRPFVNDMRKTYALTQEIDKRMNQLIRENNKIITRRVTLLRKRTVERGPDLSNLKPVTEDARNLDFDASGSWSQNKQFPFWNCLGAPGFVDFKGVTSYSVVRTSEEKEQFFGHFRYNIPNPGSLEWNRRARFMLFGGLITPETVWALTPWSWLVDWFSNVSDIMSNASINAVGSSPILYSSGIKREKSSAISHRVVTCLLEPTGTLNKWPAMAFTAASTEKTSSKARVSGGNPFGLDIKLPDLSIGQLSILAALGISRGKVK